MSAPTSISCGSKSARGSRNGVDRLSGLSDDLLHHVMSFLPMPEVVRTSLLSPRWRNLWCTTPFIRIDSQDFMDERKLENFGDCLLLLHDIATSLDEARISAGCVNDTKCSVWIRHAIMHKVRLLHISGFFCRLSLDSTAMFPSQHLKTIRLQFVTLKHGLFRPLNYDCSVLEHLELGWCSFCDHEEISSRSLKVLHICHCLHNSGLLICARNLTHLSILDPSCGAVVTRDLSSLVTASIILTSKRCHRMDKVVVDHHLLDGLSHATTLELHTPLSERAYEGRTCPRFSNLTSLVLGDWCMTADLYPLHHILQRSDKLKELTLKLEMEECSTCKALPPTRRALPSGSGSYPCIERIKIYCRKDHLRVDELVQALLPVASNAKISIERP